MQGQMWSINLHMVSGVQIKDPSSLVSCLLWWAVVCPDATQVLASLFHQERVIELLHCRLTLNCYDRERQSCVLNPKFKQSGDPENTW